MQYRQCTILSLAGSQNLCQAMNGPVETACVTNELMTGPSGFLNFTDYFGLLPIY